MLFVQYPKCTTCKKAGAWLAGQGISYEDRNIKEDNPTAQELKAWAQKSGLPARKFFNTSGQRYRELGLKDKLDQMTARCWLWRMVYASDLRKRNGKKRLRPCNFCGER